MSKVRKVRAGEYDYDAPNGTTYRIAQDYGVGNTKHGWSAFTGSASRPIGTRFSAETLRGVVGQINAAAPNRLTR